jgi:hypothetical protein
MAGGKNFGWLGLALAVLLSAGCSGILTESHYDDGRQETLRVQSGDKWSNWDRNPRKEDGTCIMLKKESTF